MVKELSKKEIIGAEVIIAEGTKERLESRWGHAFIRFIDTDKSASNDICLSLVANVHTKKLRYSAGLFGSYPILLVLDSFSAFANRYMLAEERPLARYPMVLSEGSLKNLLTYSIKMEQTQREQFKVGHAGALNDAAKKARKWIKKTDQPDSFKLILWPKENPVSILANNENEKKEFPLKYKPKKSHGLGRYTFFANNCSGALFRFFKEAGLPHKKSLAIAGRIPAKLPVRLEKSLLNPYGAYRNPVFLNLKKTKEMSLINQARLLEKNKDELENELIQQIRQNLKAKKVNFDQVYGLTNLPKIFYRPCLDQSCAQKVLGLYKSYFKPFSKKQWKRLKKASESKKDELNRDMTIKNHHQLWLEANFPSGF